MRRAVAIFLLLSLLLTPAYARKKEETPEARAERLAIEAKLLEAAAQPVSVPAFSQVGSHYYLPDGTPTNTAPTGEAVAYYDAAGNLWREAYYDDYGVLTGYVVHQFEVAFVPQTIIPGKQNLSIYRHEAVAQTRPGYVLLETQTFAVNGYSLKHEVYNYDNLGRKTDEVCYKPSGNIDFMDKTRYLANNVVYREYARDEDAPYYAFVTWYSEDGDYARSVSWTPHGEEKRNITEKIYDEQGQVIEVIERGNGSRISSRTFYTYAENGAMRNEYCLGKDGSLRYGDYPVYDERGRLIRMERKSYVDGTVSTRYYSYDEDGALRLEQEYRDDGELIEQATHLSYSAFQQAELWRGSLEGTHCVYVYHDDTRLPMFCAKYRNDRLSGVDLLDAAGNQVGRLFRKEEGWETYIYNEAGNRCGSMHYDAEGEVTGWRLYDYASAADKSISGNAEGITRTETYYDAFDQVVESSQWLDDTPQAISRRVGDQYCSYVRGENGELYLDALTQYDAYGDKIAHEVYDAAGSVIEAHRYERTRDGAGNLLSEYYYLDGELQEYTLNRWGHVSAMPPATGLHDPAPPEDDGHYREYDEDGNVTLEIEYDECGAVIRRTESTYNRVGNVLTTYSYDGEGVFVDGREYEYHDAYGLETVERHCLSDDGQYSKHIVYSNGCHREYLGDGETLVRETYHHMSDNILRKEIILDYEAGEAIRRVEMYYDLRSMPDRRVEYRVEDGENILLEDTDWTYLYDGGLMLERTETKNGELCFKETYSYNADGLPSCTMRYDAAGQLLQRTDTVYGAYENILWAQTMAADGTILERIDYFYDANGQLIKEVAQ